jgi:hypothetical protein
MTILSGEATVEFIVVEPIDLAVCHSGRVVPGRLESV